jgi:hypothetical protein
MEKLLVHMVTVTVRVLERCKATPISKMIWHQELVSSTQRKFKHHQVKDVLAVEE